MVDPVVGGLSSAIASAAIDQVREYIQQSDDSEEAWGEAVRECAITATVSLRQNYEDPKIPKTDELRREYERIGHVAQDLAVRGELREFDEGLVEDARLLATSCAEYARAPKVHSNAYIEEFRENLTEVTERIRTRTSAE